MEQQSRPKPALPAKGMIILIFLVISLIGFPAIVCFFLRKPLESLPQCLEECYRALSLWLVFFVPYAVYLFIRSRGK